MSNPKPLKAFRTEVSGVVCIVFSKSAGKARYATTRSARAAGYPVNITHVKCHRAPELDGATVFKGTPVTENTCYDNQFVVKA